MDRNLAPGKISPEKPEFQAPKASPEVFEVPPVNGDQNREEEPREVLTTPEIVIEESPKSDEAEEESTEKEKINLPEISSIDVEEKPVNTTGQARDLSDMVGKILEENAER